MSKSSNPKILTWDVETSLMTTTIFHLQRKYKNFIPYHQILDHWHMLCICWKWNHEKSVKSVSLLDDAERWKQDPTDDYHVVKTIADVIREADILVHHNGDKFDLKMLNTRLIYHKLPPLPNIPTIDTLKKVRQVADFPSNSLDSLGEFLGEGRKVSFNGNKYDLWHECLIQRSETAMKKMVKYCKQDVALNERIYLRLRPYMKTHPNIASVLTENCPKCNSEHTHISKTRITAAGIRKVQRQCNNCGSYFTLRGEAYSNDKPNSVL